MCRVLLEISGHRKICQVEASSACSSTLHGFQQGFFAGRVATDDTLESLVALNVVGETLEEGLVNDRARLVGDLGLGCGLLVGAGAVVDTEVKVGRHCCGL